MDLDPEIKNYLESFRNKGYFIAKASNIQPLLDLKQFLVKSLDFDSSDISNLSNDVILNKFHSYYSTMESDLNKVRMNIMEKIDHNSNFGSISSIVFDSFTNIITSLIGPDILAQKSTNLVIQPPESTFFSELHKDSPGNSEFELVAWVPMVNCYKGKSFYIIDKTESSKLIDSYKKGLFNSWKEFRESHYLCY